MPEASKPVASSSDKPRHRRQKRLLRSASRYATAYGRDADLSHAPSAPEASSPSAVRLDFLSLTITGGGAWHPARSTYLFPVRARSRHFRGGFVSGLRRACEARQLSRLRNRAEVDRVLKALTGTEWVVYSKPCLGRTERVVDYRFLLHVLPKGFMRVRHFGFLANRCRARRLREIRVAPEAPTPPTPAAKAETAPCAGYPCPKCHQGRLQVTARLAPQRRNPGGPTRSPP